MCIYVFLCVILCHIITVLSVILVIIWFTVKTTDMFAWTRVINYLLNYMVYISGNPVELIIRSTWGV